MAETENISTTEKTSTAPTNLVKTVETFLDLAELTIGKAYGRDIKDIAKHWVKKIQKEYPSITAIELKEIAQVNLNGLVTELPSYAQFRLIGKLQPTATRQPISAHEWDGK